jgi:predicted hotdog family 3-hydroxylacyl-ACP dehydratase
MVLLDALTAWAPGRAECRMVVREDAPFVVDGELGAPMTIEHMAQAVAACLGYEAFQGGAGVRVGMIIACKRFEARVAALAAGDELRVRVERVRGNDTLSHFECAVWRADSREAPVASATLTLFHGERPPG